MHGAHAPLFFGCMQAERKLKTARVPGFPHPLINGELHHLKLEKGNLKGASELSEYRLEMREVVKTFPGVKALDHAQLKLKPGTVHALMGENGAGKSTLMKCMFGIYHMDEGEVYYEGEKVSFKGPLDALKKGIAMVHQELQPITERSIGENIYVGRYPTKHYGPVTVIDHDKMYKDAAEVLEKVHLNFDPRAKLSSLSVSQMQLVEIAKAVSAQCKVLILDEPTSSLTAAEVEALFTIVNELRAEGVSIVYISHKMDEILRISDEVTIMRDGQYVGTWEAKELTTDFIITKMVGRELTNLYPPRSNTPGEVIYKVEDFTSINPKSFRHCSFEVRKGEILGVAALVGVYMWFLYNKTRHGKYMYAIGGNENAAQVAGVNVSATLIRIYILASVLYAFGGFLLGAKAGGASTATGFGYELEAIAACTVGGVSANGGVGTIPGVLVGVLVFETLKICLQFLGVDPAYTYIAQGLVIVLAVALDLRKYLAKK